MERINGGTVVELPWPDAAAAAAAAAAEDVVPKSAALEDVGGGTLTELDPGFLAEMSGVAIAAAAAETGVDAKVVAPAAAASGHHF